MSQAPAPKEYKLSKRSAYYIFTLLFLLYFFDYVDRMIVTSLFPFIQQEWGLTDTQSGLLVSVVYWSIVAFVFPVSILVDRWSRKKTIGIMALIWSLATLACAFTKSFPQLLVTRSAIGIGEAGYAPAGTAMLSGLFPPEKRSRMMGLWNMSIPLGHRRRHRRRRIRRPALGMAARLWPGGAARRAGGDPLFLCQGLQDSGAG